MSRSVPRRSANTCAGLRTASNPAFRKVSWYVNGTRAETPAVPSRALTADTETSALESIGARAPELGAAPPMVIVWTSSAVVPRWSPSVRVTVCPPRSISLRASEVNVDQAASEPPGARAKASGTNSIGIVTVTGLRARSERTTVQPRSAAPSEVRTQNGEAVSSGERTALLVSPVSRADPNGVS